MVAPPCWGNGEQPRPEPAQKGQTWGPIGGTLKERLLEHILRGPPDCPGWTEQHEREMDTTRAWYRFHQLGEAAFITGWSRNHLRACSSVRIRRGERRAAHGGVTFHARTWSAYSGSMAGSATILAVARPPADVHDVLRIPGRRCSSLQPSQAIIQLSPKAVNPEKPVPTAG